MKWLFKYIIIISCMMAVHEMNAQIEDQNTVLINTYFNLNGANYIDGYNNLESTIFQSVNILQFGNDNNIDINSSGKSKQKVNQIGNNNNFQYLDYYNSADMSLDVLQEGNNSSIQVYGMNSLMKNMLIKQSASDKTIIITNY